MTENNKIAQGEAFRASPDEMTTAIVSAYVSNNSVPKADLPDLISSVRSAIGGAAYAAAGSATPVKQPTAAEIKKSITPDALISFIDGKAYKTIRRHLTTNGLSFEDYKAKFGLPADYPSVAANYSEKRAALAKTFGLGGQRRKRSA